MDGLWLLADDGDGDGDGRTPSLQDLFGTNNPRNTIIQISLSLALGIGAFLAFCVLRPRWAGLYAARKKQKNEAAPLPELPDSLFGWMLPLWRITDQQVLASAGLDAYVFLAFFKMAMKFLAMTLIFSLIVIKPVHDANPDDADDGDDGDKHGKHGKHQDAAAFVFEQALKRSRGLIHQYNGTNPGNGTWYDWPQDMEINYLWMYLVFAYLFSALAVYLIVAETRRIIEVRQEFLGAQTTVTDRTIRLSGIPAHLQDEAKIKEFIEALDIGKVDTVTLCRNWRELDKAMIARMDTLRRLEEAYTIHLGYRRIERNHETLPIAQPAPPEPNGNGINDGSDEVSMLIGQNGASVRPYSKARPKATIRYGRFGLRRKKVDAIDYYEEKLREADEKIRELRAKEFPATPLAFVTMDSVAACQMAMQAVLDPSPLQLIANQSPEPQDVIWPNTYLSRRSRIARAWSITALIVLLTVFWVAILIPVAGLLTPAAIKKVFPGLGQVLEDHENIKSLINTQLPTLIASLLMVLVPYLYYWLSWYQGQISAGDIELSAISKNFFFTFFNFFVVFMVLGTASKFYEIFAKFGDAIRDISKIAYTLAVSLQGLLPFYTNFIILQGVGLFPFRLLEVGSVSLYPIMLMGAKTPRDYAELVQPPIFSYGFYLPNALLIFVICMVYSVLRSSWQVLLAGFLYFALGHQVYKYQLLYAMDHRQQTSGRAWGMICDRIFIGLIFFQVTTAGQLIFKQAFIRAAMLAPLVIVTIWMNLIYGRTYKPLMKYIALSSVKRGEQYSDRESPEDPDNPVSYAASLSSMNIAPEMNIWARSDTAVTESRRIRERSAPSENGMRFINPSLVAPLGGIWIADKNFRSGGVGSNPETYRDENAYRDEVDAQQNDDAEEEEIGV